MISGSPFLFLMRLLSHLFLGTLAGVWMTVPALAAPLELLTAKEAAQPNLPIPKAGLPAIGELVSAKPPGPDAPKIIVEKPAQGVGVHRPFPVKIRFVLRSGHKIDLD